MADIQPVKAEIRRGKKQIKKIEEEETTGQKYNGLPYSIGGHNNNRFTALCLGLPG